MSPASEIHLPFVELEATKNLHVLGFVPQLLYKDMGK